MLTLGKRSIERLFMKMPTTIEKLKKLWYRLWAYIQNAPLQVKITTAFIVALAVTLIIVGVTFLYQINKQMHEQLIVEGTITYRNASYAISYGLLTEDVELVNPYLNGVFSNSNLVAIEIYNLDGQLLTRRSSDTSLKPYDSDFIRNLLDKQTNELIQQETPDWIEFMGPSYYESQHEKPELIGYLRVIIDKTGLQKNPANLILTIVIVAIIAFAVGATLAFMLGQRIISPLREMTTAMEQIARGEGDLTQQLEITHEDEIGQMARSFNQFTDKLNQIVQDIIRTSTQIGQLTADTTTTVAHFAERVNSQASFVNETSTSVKELSATASSIADDSNLVLQTADDSHRSAQAGVQSVSRSQAKMREIHDKNMQATQEIIRLGKKSKEIQHIMHMIHGISLQSKMIAFNAAIESATTGAVGKRFGVVASQIRELANSVFDSTEDIKRIVREVQQAVDDLVKEFREEQASIQEGVETIESAMDVLNRIAEKSELSVQKMKQISQATKQQTHASGQVVFSLQEIMDEATELNTNGAYFQQTIEAINELAQTLQQEVGKFKVKST